MYSIMPLVLRYFNIDNQNSLYNTHMYKAVFGLFAAFKVFVAR